MGRSARDIQDYVSSLDLPAVRTTRGAKRGAPVAFKQEKEVVAVGAQLTEFSDSVPADLRPPISNSMLLAQLAADKATAEDQDVMQWHAKYRDVLKKVGWQLADAEDRKRVITDKDLSVHQAIIPVLTTLLGPAAAATSMVVTVLKGLQEMDKESPWITLFDRESQHASGAKFQISYVDADENGAASVKLLSCTIEAERKITQVLFFKFSSQRAEMRDRQTLLSTNREVLESGKEAIAKKVGVFINEFVENIEL
ncbi:MAG: hypothetical protein K0Q92_735 [Steroidobacteraceae bacterium]|jgi:hypothetical protein|nr:hypothetical protein [Steroidobacteraceae bacterium]